MLALPVKHQIESHQSVGRSVVEERLVEVLVMLCYEMMSDGTGASYLARLTDRLPPPTDGLRIDRRREGGLPRSRGGRGGEEDLMAEDA
jgi:hypothetical protein